MVGQPAAATPARPAAMRHATTTGKRTAGRSVEDKASDILAMVRPGARAQAPAADP